MKVLVTGGRDFDDWACLDEVLTYVYLKAPIKNGRINFTIVEGGAKGADFLSRVWAKFRFLNYEEYPAEWKLYGKSAGFIRNKKMLELGPDYVVSFPGGNGTAHMVSLIKEKGYVEEVSLNGATVWAKNKE